jgi:hypothetical protein
MIKHLLRGLFFLVAFQISTFDLYGQKMDYIPKRGENNEVLIRVDSLSFMMKNNNAEYYVDSITNQPYTGKAGIYYGTSGLDSLNLINGIQNGWLKEYQRKNKNDSLVLNRLRYYDQETLSYVSNYVLHTEFRKYSSFVKFYKGKALYFYEIVYKPHKIIIKQSVTTKSGKEKNRIKLKAVKELDSFLSQHEPIYLYCKQAGFFGEPEIE